MNTKLQYIQIDLMKDSKLEENEFIEKYAERIRDILDNNFLKDKIVQNLVLQILNCYNSDNIQNWQNWKVIEAELWKIVFNKLKRDYDNNW